MSTAQDDSLTQIAARRIKSAGGAVIDTLLPPQELLGLEADPIARRMWADVTFLDAPWCEACGFPFEYAVQGGSLCARCSVKRPAFDRARAPMAYDEGSRALILSFKHGGRTDAPRLGLCSRPQRSALTDFPRRVQPRNRFPGGSNWADTSFSGIYPGYSSTFEYY